MPRLLLASTVLAAACAAPAQSTTPTGVAPGHVKTSESEWNAAADLAAMLARAAGGQRVAPALRVRERGPLVRRRLTLAAGGCYHVGVAWGFAADLEASVALDPGTNAQLALDDRRIAAPGGAIDFCTDHGGGATLTFRPASLPVPDLLELAVVYGAAPESVRARNARHTAEAKHVRQARTDRQ
jgi:hypothetical protein